MSHFVSTESIEMILSSSLPLGSLFFKHWHTDDTEIGVAIAKAAFQIRPDGSLKTIRPAPDLNPEDQYEGDPGTSAMITEQEIAPAKTATDITVRATAYAPGGRRLTEWPVGVSIPDRLNYRFHVRGPAMWENGLLGWRMSDPEPVSEVPISYALAYGGPAMGDPDAQNVPVHEMNLAGRGHATAETLKGKTPFPAPQIGELSQFVSAEAGKPMQVHGLGPMGKAWLPRRALAGTFDEDWEKTRHPRMPKDYDLGFWNNAHPQLQVKDYLTGNETVYLHGMAVGGGDISFTLPGFKLMLAATGDNVAKNHTMKLDTLSIDVSDPDPENHQLSLIWRALITGPARFDAGQLQAVKLE